MDFKDLISHSKEYGFIYPSSEIYDGLSAVYDYGPYGVELKNNIKQYWWKSMVQMHENIVGIDAAIFMHPKTWKASGHVDAFNDPLVDNKDSKKRYRADQLIEGYAEKIEEKIKKGEQFDDCTDTRMTKDILSLLNNKQMNLIYSQNSEFQEVAVLMKVYFLQQLNHHNYSSTDKIFISNEEMNKYKSD